MYAIRESRTTPRTREVRMAKLTAADERNVPAGAPGPGGDPFAGGPPAPSFIDGKPELLAQGEVIERHAPAHQTLDRGRIGQQTRGRVEIAADEQSRAVGRLLRGRRPPLQIERRPLLRER